MLPAVLLEPFDGRDLVAVVSDREAQTRVDRGAVDQDRAGAALAVVAALLGPGEPEAVTQRVEQDHVGCHVQLLALTVDGQRDALFTLRGRRVGLRAGLVRRTGVAHLGKRRCCCHCQAGNARGLQETAATGGAWLDRAALGIVDVYARTRTRVVVHGIILISFRPSLSCLSLSSLLSACRARLGAVEAAKRPARARQPGSQLTPAVSGGGGLFNLGEPPGRCKAWRWIQEYPAAIAEDWA